MLSKPNPDVHIIGPGRSKELTAAFGREFLTFLECSGVILAQGENDCVFVRKSKENEEDPSNESSAPRG